MLDEIEYIVELLIENNLVKYQYESVMTILYEMDSAEINNIYNILIDLMSYDFNDIKSIKSHVSLMDDIEEFNDIIAATQIK